MSLGMRPHQTHSNTSQPAPTPAGLRRATAVHDGARTIAGDSGATAAEVTTHELPHAPRSPWYAGSAPLREALEDVFDAVAPLWPLRDYVAVNPFVGLTHKRFLDVRRALRRVRNTEMLMPLAYFRQLLTKGDIHDCDLERAWEQCRREYPEEYNHAPLVDLLDVICVSGHPAGAAAADSQSPQELSQRSRPPAATDAPADAPADAQAVERVVWTVAEAVDRQQPTHWSETIVGEVSRHCASHFDEGQAAWRSPWQQQSLWSAWRSAATIDRRPELLGLRGFRRFAASLPEQPEDLVAQALTQLSVPESVAAEFLLGELLSVAGWAAYVRGRDWRARTLHGDQRELLELLAIRLAYDLALIDAGQAANQGALGVVDSGGQPLDLWPTAGAAAFAQPESKPAAVREGKSAGPAHASRQYELARYLLQVASEEAYRRRLASSLLKHVPAAPEPGTRKKVQMVFCIDVRSELFRRHLESTSHEVETFGFAGFFGLPIEYVPLGGLSGVAQCPVLLKPSYRVEQGVRGADSTQQTAARAGREHVRGGRLIWKSFQHSAASCFSYVESLGATYLFKLVADSLRWTRPVAGAEFDGVPHRERHRLGPVLPSGQARSRTFDSEVALAEGVLRNLGLTANHARLVVLCGHASQTVNNPYRAGLDCGACGGHSGESNARLAATLLNDVEIRCALAGRGLVVPDDVWFVAAVHNTTTDDVTLHDVDLVPCSHSAELEELRGWLSEAAWLARAERAGRLGDSGPLEVLARSRDWSEVRPEWGLAGNAAFIVAPRSRTRGLALEGRAFMHSYDYRQDGDWRVLELIMTAPMIVTNWINMQYYASAVDNRAYGSGNKVIHNLVGQFGVVQGNGGDLMTGLPWQSLHDGEQLQHEPLRLSVMIEAPRSAIDGVLDKHPKVSELVDNGWMNLLAIEGDQLFRHAAPGLWQPLELDS
jgi:uncharacterized protein